jgi:hypothetical protein
MPTFLGFKTKGEAGIASDRNRFNRIHLDGNGQVLRRGHKPD